MDTLKPLYFYLDKVETNARLNWWRKGNRHWRPDLVQRLGLNLQPLCGCCPLLRLRCYCVYGHCSNFDRCLGWDSSGNRRCHFDVSRWGDRECKLRKKMEGWDTLQKFEKSAKNVDVCKKFGLRMVQLRSWKCKKVKNMILFVVVEWAGNCVKLDFYTF